MLAAILVALSAGCSYPRLIDEGRLDEAYLARIAAGMARVCSFSLERPVPAKVVDARRAHELMKRSQPPWAEQCSRWAALEAFGFYLSKHVASDEGAMHFRLRLALDEPDEAVAAFYDPHDQTFTLIDRAPPSGPLVALLVGFVNWKTGSDFLNELSASHELVHAFQDRTHGLLRWWNPISDDDDAALARQAVIEGEAVERSFCYLGLEDTVLTREDSLAGLDSGSAAIERERLAFPYWAGTAFVRAVRGSGRDRASIWKEPPRSTREILEPERYLARRSVERVMLQSCEVPPGWRVVRENVLGAFLASVLVGREVRDWAADRYRVYQDEQNRLALAWTVSFDTEAGAREFAADYARLQARKPVRVKSCASTGKRSVIVVEAPDQATFEAIGMAVNAPDGR